MNDNLKDNLDYIEFQNNIYKYQEYKCFNLSKIKEVLKFFAEKNIHAYDFVEENIINVKKAKEALKEFDKLNTIDPGLITFYPKECPITKKPFFMVLEHPTKGLVPTYGGPFESYTIPERNDEDEFEVEIYDHDEGYWKEETEILDYVCERKSK